MNDKYIKFWGTRGSCPVSGPEYLHFGGNTSCVELFYEGVHMIFDAGTGIRPLGKSMLDGKGKEIDLYLSHTHWDHIQGFPFFEPIFQPNVNINIRMPLGQGRSCRDLFKELLAPEFFPLRLSQLQANLQFHAIEELASIQKGPINLTFHKLNHPGLAYGFKIKTPHQIIGYVSDNELPMTVGAEQESLIEFYRGCDLLIHEAQYFPEEYVQKKGWGHSCVIETIHFVEQTGAGKWLVSHHDPAHTDEDLRQLEKIARTKSSIPSEWIRDGQILELE